MHYIRWFETLRMEDVSLVGGKNAALGEMIHAFKHKNIPIPNGFAITAEAYRYYLVYNKLEAPMRVLMRGFKHVDDIKKLQKIGAAIRRLLLNGHMPPDLAQEIGDAYRKLSVEYKDSNLDVAVRSSATAEDLPTASFAGQQETFLNIRGDKAIVEACKKSFASLFTDRAISYRVEKEFDHFKVALSIGVQKMVRSDRGVAGVAFSLDTESGFKDVVMINGSYGLGESIVQGLVSPDEFYVFKPTLRKGLKPIIKKQLGDKKHKIVYGADRTKTIKTVKTSVRDQNRFCLNDEHVLHLSSMVCAIEDYYSKKNKRWTPMDVEWAQDADGVMYIVQARPETVHANMQHNYRHTTYQLKHDDRPSVIVTGQSIGQQIVSGVARVVRNVSELKQVKKGDIIITRMTDPDWVPVMKKAAGIVTDLGGRTCHAAIVSRELNTPALVGTQQSTRKIKNGQKITIDCSQGAQGYVYEGHIPFEVKQVDTAKLSKPPVPIYVNLASPDTAFTTSMLPVDGVGLARVEFIISNDIKVHPMALVHPELVKKREQAFIKKITRAYPTEKDFFINTLAQGVGTIAAAFYPKPVIVRLSDFKTNEYHNLIGGHYFEHEEANPMIGFRGASRYIHKLYAEAFALECKAMVKVRDEMGLDNVRIMIPFVRTTAEAKGVVEALAKHGLQRGKNNLELVMMCEIPSNVILMDQFSRYFDGFSIGSNDLTQLTLGVDRDSAILAPVFDERDPAMVKMFAMAIEAAHENKKFIGICGQAPSDYREIADFLITQHIDSISLNPDSVIPFLLRYTS